MTKRIPRVNKLIKKELSQILLREVEFPSGVLVTITRVEASSNLGEAKIYVSVMPEHLISRVFQILNRQIYEIQQALNKRLKMRPVPRIRFIQELKAKEAGRIEELLEKIKENH